jgi:hypothetical protein
LIKTSKNLGPLLASKIAAGKAVFWGQRGSIISATSESEQRIFFIWQLFSHSFAPIFGDNTKDIKNGSSNRSRSLSQ